MYTHACIRQDLSEREKAKSTEHCSILVLANERTSLSLRSYLRVTVRVNAHIRLLGLPNPIGSTLSNSIKLEVTVKSRISNLEVSSRSLPISIFNYLHARRWRSLAILPPSIQGSPIGATSTSTSTLRFAISSGETRPRRRSNSSPLSTHDHSC
ncbi:hypothetical protein K474DRAFT_1669163 [Panus rudis PR-1116 ss-1]|nr:hypothetical protein K474DRAFT_1669163 [Panus rudis PR-1116 ss-1]